MAPVARRICTCSFRLCFLLLALGSLVRTAPAQTPPELDAVVERFKVTQDAVTRLDLAFEGLDQ